MFNGLQITINVYWLSLSGRLVLMCLICQINVLLKSYYWVTLSTHVESRFTDVMQRPISVLIVLFCVIHSLAEDFNKLLYVYQSISSLDIRQHQTFNAYKNGLINFKLCFFVWMIHCCDFKLHKSSKHKIFFRVQLCNKANVPM